MVDPRMPEDAQPAAAKDAAPSAAATFKKLGAAGPLALVAAALPAVAGVALLGSLNTVGPWLRSHEEAGFALYVAAFAVLAGLALLPTYAQSILGGWAFGFALGFPGALAGFLGGATIGYIVARRAASKNVGEVLRDHPKWQAVRDALVGRGFWKTLGVVALLRLPLNSPFALSNLVFGSTKVAMVPYLLGTLMGMAPRTGIAVYLAHSVRNLTAAEAAEQRPGWMIWAGIGSVLAVGAALTWIANRSIRGMTIGGART